MIRVAINGYGRIGRCVVRAIFENNMEDEITVVAINDLADKELLTHLTKYDSTLGIFHGDVSRSGDNLVINGKEIQFLSISNPEELPWGDLGIDICLECSGHFATRELSSKHLVAGAQKVLVSQPCAGADNTVVFGVNHKTLKAEDTIISNASCTTNCLAPMLKVIHETVGVEYGSMTTIQSYTNDQNLIDKAPGDFYRSRSATQSMIPTRTGAAKAVGLVLPEMDGKLMGMAVRVPTLNVSLVDLHVHCEKVVSVEDLHTALKKASENELKGVLAFNEKPLVSIDFLLNPASCIFDANHTQWSGKQLKVMAWYDNEWAFSLRMLDVVKHISSL